MALSQYSHVLPALLAHPTMYDTSIHGVTVPPAPTENSAVFTDVPSAAPTVTATLDAPPPPSDSLTHVGRVDAIFNADNVQVAAEATEEPSSSVKRVHRKSLPPGWHALVATSGSNKQYSIFSNAITPVLTIAEAWRTRAS